MVEEGRAKVFTTVRAASIRDDKIKRNAMTITHTKIEEREKLES